VESVVCTFTYQSGGGSAVGGRLEGSLAASSRSLADDPRPVHLVDVSINIVRGSGRMAEERWSAADYGPFGVIIFRRYRSPSNEDERRRGFAWVISSEGLAICTGGLPFELAGFLGVGSHTFA
jgi:hypothetical protein